MESLPNDAHYSINRNLLLSAMRSKGFRSVEALAEAIGLHRNTIGNYLQGTVGLPSALSKILDALELCPEELFENTIIRRKIPGVQVADLVDGIVALCPKACVVLYGSRARGNAKKYSDYDLGVYREEEIRFEEFSPLLTVAEEFNAESLVTAQLTNLCNADDEFLKNIRRDISFSGGSFKSWLNLLRHAGVRIYE